MTDSGPNTVGRAMQQAASLLARQGIPDAGRDVRYLMAAALGISRDRLILQEPEALEPGPHSTFDRFVAARLGREPVSRILGVRAFYGREFKVTPYVLDPRPETETLIDLALDEPFTSVLDLGTGSGCIALTLLAERSEATAIATDISQDALETAGANAVRLNVLGRVHFELSDWFQAVGGKFDLIVSNPPYIHPNELCELLPEVERCDPKIALTDSLDGLSAYRTIASNAMDHLVPGGRLLVEIGPTQAEAVSGYFRAAGLEDVRIHADLDGRDRVIASRAPL